jgi:hypothetical protein
MSSGYSKLLFFKLNVGYWNYTQFSTTKKYNISEIIIQIEFKCKYKILN